MRQSRIRPMKYFQRIIIWKIAYGRVNRRRVK